ncbi:MAG TPA: type II secretion system F family protein [Chthonomonadaceae bacterium]|nr:type II secretion system F family protein [Chthonomonadaceae bacterium]
MPQFTFKATDRMGNTVEGTVAAADPLLANDQVRRMGYVPVTILPTGEQAAGSAPDTLATAPPVGMTPGQAAAPAPSGPKPIDLTQPVTELPAFANPLLAPLTGEGSEATANMERIEPWQRGGPVPQSLSPLPLPGQAARVEAIQEMPPAGGATYRTPPRLETARGLEHPGIPYGLGVARRVSLWQRAKETLIYPIFSGVVIKDLAPFYRQFATLINAGLPLYQALVALESNTNNRKLKEIARAGQAQVQAGGRFSEVMAAYPWIFPPMQIELVRAAEQGGMLDRVLLQIADYIEHELEIRRLISRETLYPKFVLFVALMILGKPGFEGGMPAIAQLVVGSMGKLPYTFWNYLQDTFGWGLAILLPLLAAVVVFRLFLFNVKGVRETYDTFKMSLPVLGNLVRQFAVAKFARTFAALYRGGFSMGASLQIAGDACGNAVLRNAAHKAIAAADRGELISGALSASGIFPRMTIDLFRTGETSGNLDEMLDKAADFHEQEARTKSHQAAIAFGVIVFLAVALMVARAIVGFYSGYAAGVSAAGGE